MQQHVQRHFAGFVALAGAGPGPQAYLDALEAKHALFRDGSDHEAMLRSVFTARRRLDMAEAKLVLDGRYATEDRKKRGAAEDLAAEAAHFRDPARVPLRTRWARDALRELEIADEAPLLDHLRYEGLYRGLHWWADLVLAHAYVEYLRAMSGGVLGSDFTRAMTPAEQLAKLLGIATRTQAAHADP